MSRCYSSAQGWAAAAAARVPNRGVRTSPKPALPEPETLGSLLPAPSGEGAAHPREGQPRRSTLGCRSGSLLPGADSWLLCGRSASTAPTASQGAGACPERPFLPGRPEGDRGQGFLKPAAVWPPASFPPGRQGKRICRWLAGHQRGCGEALGSPPRTSAGSPGSRLTKGPKRPPRSGWKNFLPFHRLSTRFF